jgi:dihydrofolate synthase/folylpolyglutamate synthase
LTRYGNNPRSVPPEQLAARLAPTPGVRVTVWPSAGAAWAAARAAARPEDLICITGSVFLAGELWPVVTDAGTTSSGERGASSGERGA